MMQVFEMSDLGEMSYFLGIEIKQRQNEVFICQEKYAKELLKKFNMENCKIMDSPMCQKEKLCKDDGSEKVEESHYRSLIGCLMYLTTRLDILYVVSVLSRFMNCANGANLKAAKRVIRYVKGTLNFGVKFCSSQSFELQGYSNCDWAGSFDMKSTFGFCFTFESTAEAEVIAATSAVNHTLWLRKILSDLHLEQKMSTDVMVDNQAAISISNNPVFHGKTRHCSSSKMFKRMVKFDSSIARLEISSQTYLQKSDLRS
ncbi:transmembrane signal receptor [Lithospermum erythrorhizon]|uniref:Transmembrane signal receptor n=1 Tax=Lithospermum erythrorhizon TaxID=34254 RepID=A0AAV3NZF4_LITER